MSDFPIVSVDEMKALEARAFSLGMSYEEMMARAGNGCAAVLRAECPNPANCLGLVGKGNNGGDTLIALAVLQSAGWQSVALLPQPRSPQDRLMIRLQEAGGSIVVLDFAGDWRQQVLAALSHADVILDGLLGTGARLPLPAPISDLLSFLQSQATLPPVYALDCPSGIDCASGEAATEALAATQTLCIEALKTGQLQFPAASFCGRLRRIPLGFPAGTYPSQAPRTSVLTSREARALLPTRPDDAHKGTFGSVLVVAGSARFSGAAILSIGAALRSGPGLVYGAVPASLHDALAPALPEAIWELLPEHQGSFAEHAAESFPALLQGKSAVLIGPGLGQSPPAQMFQKKLLSGNLFGASPQLPTVLDADALRTLASLPNWPMLLPAGCLLTPHPGEMSALCALSVSEIQAHRIETARHFAREWQQYLILKGANTIIADPTGTLEVLPCATSALAHGGSGDVLAGIAVGLLAQGLPVWDAARLAVWLHAACARLALQKTGHSAAVLAGDLVSAIGQALHYLESGETFFA
jgi:hydroxyethylthiazole kinase-like uncharacterized protein yjeF